MSAKVWALGDAVVDLLPDGHGRLLNALAVPPPTSRSAWRGLAARADLSVASGTTRSGHL